jgi:quercetin dioxygenase-like cupin family protein
MILETAFSKEIRIALKQGQLMKEHQTPYPIVIEMVEGEVDFGVNGTKQVIKKGDLLTLEGKVPHDLLALQNSIIRLTLSKLDKAERVEAVAKD